MSNFLVRAAKAGDAEGIAAVHTASWQTTYRGILPNSFLDELPKSRGPQRLALWTGLIAKPEPKSAIFVAEMDKKIVGFVNCGPTRDIPPLTDGEIFAIYLLEEFQRQEIGRALFDRAREFFASLGLRSFSVWVADKNPSRGFYERMGGRLNGEKKDSIAGQDLNEVRYVWMKG